MCHVSRRETERPDKHSRSRRGVSQAVSGSARAGVCALLMLLFPAFMMVTAPGLADEHAGGKVKAEEAGTQEDYRYFSSKSENGIKLYVGTQLLQVKQGEEPAGYIPLLWGLENLEHRGLTVNRDRIQLYSPNGTEIPLAALEAFRREYDRQRYDRQALELTNFDGQLEQTARRVHTSFFPLPGETAIDLIQVPQWGKVIDLLYFSGSVKQGKRLRLEVGFLEEVDDISVEFTIP